MISLELLLRIQKSTFILKFEWIQMRNVSGTDELALQRLPLRLNIALNEFSSFLYRLTTRHRKKEDNRNL